MTNLVELALAAEARGRAFEHLAAARRQTNALWAELEREARELVDDAQRRSAIAARPGEQLRLATFEAAFAGRQVALERRRRHGRLAEARTA